MNRGLSATLARKLFFGAVLQQRVDNGGKLFHGKGCGLAPSPVEEFQNPPAAFVKQKQGGDPSDGAKGLGKRGGTFHDCIIGCEAFQVAFQLFPV